MSNNIIEIKNLSKTYFSIGEDVNVLKNINWSLKKGDSAAILGESGVGKSTLLYVLGLLTKPTDGEIFYNNKNLTDAGDLKKSKFIKNNIGFIFQFFQLFNDMTLWENLYFVAKMYYNNEEAQKECEKLIEYLGLEDRKEQTVTYLSGGEKQRVSVARALLKNPEVLLADEPTGNLDEKNAQKILDFIFKIKEERDLSLVMVTHNQKIAGYCNKKYELHNKSISEVSI